MTEIIHEPTIFAEPIFHLGSMTITNSLLASLLAVAVLVIIGICLRFSLKNIPKGLQNVFETILEGALNLCDQVTGQRRLSLKILPIALTIFLFVLANNWLGLLPGVGTIGQIRMEEGRSIFVPYLRGGTADINTTLALGIFSVLGANIFGILSVGLWKTFNKYVNLKVLASIFTEARRDLTVLIVAPVRFFVGLVETIGEFAKVASLSFRLFGNIFAGEVLLISLGAFAAYAVPVPFIFLEILIGLIQALVFSTLTLVYFTIAAESH